MNQPRRQTTPPIGATESRVLLVEDDTAIATEISNDLTARGHHLTHLTTGPAARDAALPGRFDLIIMDRMLPGLDGLSVIAQLRAHGITTPVLVLSALTAVDERIRGLRAGGDDYLAKPFDLDELAARVEALLRRPLETRGTILTVGPLRLDLIERDATRNGRRITLLPREYTLLLYLMRRPDQVITRAMLLEDVWHYRFVPQTNLVDVHIGKLPPQARCTG